MRGMNRIVIVGRLGQEPELRMSKGNTAWATFSVATTGAAAKGSTGWRRPTGTT
jgi:single-stranded DNA-binding protein